MKKKLEIKECESCHSKRLLFTSNEDGTLFIKCSKCGSSSASGKCVEEAISIWNTWNNLQLEVAAPRKAIAKQIPFAVTIS